MRANLALLVMLPCMAIGAICAVIQAGFGAGHLAAMGWLEETAKRETGGDA